jgi:hypothetical protein
MVTDSYNAMARYEYLVWYFKYITSKTKSWMQHIYVGRAKLELNSQWKHAFSSKHHFNNTNPTTMQTLWLLNFFDDSPLPEGLHSHAPRSTVLSPSFVFSVFSFDHRAP